MNQTIYPIGIQNFEKIRKDGYLYIDYYRTVLLPQPPPALREKPVAVHAGGLLPREKGVVRRTGHGETGKGLERIPDPPF